MLQIESLPKSNKWWTEPGGFGSFTWSREKSAQETRQELKLTLEKVTRLSLNKEGTAVPLYL